MSGGVGATSYNDPRGDSGVTSMADWTRVEEGDSTKSEVRLEEGGISDWTERRAMTAVTEGMSSLISASGECVTENWTEGVVGWGVGEGVLTALGSTGL